MNLFIYTQMSSHLDVNSSYSNGVFSLDLLYCLLCRNLRYIFEYLLTTEEQGRAPWFAFFGALAFLFNWSMDSSKIRGILAIKNFRDKSVAYIIKLILLKWLDFLKLETTKSKKENSNGVFLRMMMCVHKLKNY